MAHTTPTQMTTSPTLKTFANGTHRGKAKMSVSGPSAGLVSRALLE